MAALTVGGGVLRVVLARQDLFADELATYWVVSTRGLTGVVETVSTTAEITPPLSFVLTWFTTRLGLGPELVRLPALIAGIASIPLVFAVGSRTVGRRAALVATALTTLSPFMIYYSAEARGYGVLMALVLLSTLSLLRAVEDGGRGWWVLYAACACLAAYTHYTSVFVLAVQVGWALWVHPPARRPLLVATTAAAVLFVPWLPSLRGDLDSPTTVILDVLSPLDAASVRLSVGQWSVGFPGANFGIPLSHTVSGSSLRDVPGIAALLLLGAALVVGALGVFSARGGREPAGKERRLVLVILLALATPVGTLVQSVVGTNVFRTRSLAASWPYLALAVATVLTAGRPLLRRSATALGVAAFVMAAAGVMNPDVQRPDHGRLAQVAEEHGSEVIVYGAAYTPGPLTTFDVEGSTPDAEVLRLNVPEQRESPFTLMERRPDPADIAQRAAAAARGGPITLISFVPPLPVVDAFIERLPPGYVLTHTEVVPGIFELEALVFERLP